MMKRALIVGIDDYPNSPLTGCINDANAMHELLRRNQDGSPNFDCELIAPSETGLTRAELRRQIRALFAHKADIALLYFAGHGAHDQRGGVLVTTDAEEADEGIPMDEILKLAGTATIGEVVIILDACYSGAIGEIADSGVSLREGVSVLAACRADQTAAEQDGGGAFTTLVCGALSGGGADVLGDVSIASVYAYVEQALGAWEQRPLLKANVARLTALRRCLPPIDLPTLRLLPSHFPMPDYDFALDPSYEPDAEPDHPEHERVFEQLQQYRAARLLEPVGEQHVYYAAMNSRSCRLTPLGQFYWTLAKRNRL